MSDKNPDEWEAFGRTMESFARTMGSLGVNIAREAASFAAKVCQEAGENSSNFSSIVNFNNGITIMKSGGNSISIRSTGSGENFVTTIKVNGPGKVILDINGKKMEVSFLGL